MQASSVTKTLIGSQIVSAVGLLVCIVLKPTFLFSSNQGGVSNYGVEPVTIVPFTLAFVGSSVLIMRAAQQIKSWVPVPRNFQRALLMVSAAQLLALLTTYPYKASPSLNILHNGSAILLFCIELWLTIWLLRGGSTRQMRVAAGLFLLGFVLSVLTFTGKIHTLFIAEVLTSFSFGALLICTAQRYERTCKQK